MLAKESEAKVARDSPPNLREAADYYNAPLADRCFNCIYLKVENLKFECSKFAVKTNVYSVCDDWKPCLERDGGCIRLFFTSGQEIEAKAETGNGEPFLLISKKNQ